jgi:hypothetical protein
MSACREVVSLADEYMPRSHLRETELLNWPAQQPRRNGATLSGFTNSSVPSLPGALN